MQSPIDYYDSMHDTITNETIWLEVPCIEAEADEDAADGITLAYGRETDYIRTQ
jgi:hypothetical protein